MTTDEKRKYRKDRRLARRAAAASAVGAASGIGVVSGNGNGDGNGIKKLRRKRSAKKLPERQPWEILDVETASSYAAFKLYRDMNPLDRTVGAVAKLLGKSASAITALSSDYNWPQRAASWDYHIECARLELSEQYQLDMFKRHADVCVSLIDKVKLRLARMKPETLKPRDIAQWIDVATKIERLSRGVANESTAKSLTQINVQIDQMARLSDAELERIISDEKKRQLRVKSIEANVVKEEPTPNA